MTSTPPRPQAVQEQEGHPATPVAVEQPTTAPARMRLPRTARRTIGLTVAVLGVCAALTASGQPTPGTPLALQAGPRSATAQDARDVLTHALAERAEHSTTSRSAARATPAAPAASATTGISAQGAQGTQSTASGAEAAASLGGYASLARVAADTQSAVKAATAAADQASAAGVSAVATAEEIQRVAREQAAAEAAAKAAAEAAAAAAAKAAAAAEAAQRDPRGLGRTLAADRGWGGDQFTCLDHLWTKESGWTWSADNPTSSAYGIPQALPGKKMASAGADWQTNPATQIAWGLTYIKSTYGTPCGAWAHSQSVGWY